MLFPKRLALVVLFSFPAAAVAPSTTQLASLLKLAPRLAPQALEAALTALQRLQATGAKVRSDVVTVIDYTKPSTERRLWVFDLAHTRVLFQELAAHGKNSGDNQAVRFSNARNSLMTSIGAFLTGETYIGQHGLSLRLQGLEKGVNDNSMDRALVIHAAAYVSDALAKARGRIGRSWGCPAVRPEISRSLIQTVQGGSLVLAYYPDKTWLQTSKLVGVTP
uniref:YkuD domain-containing protein n=1 Tax=Solibacter usitatus (strain Ellin6076) TaxID=234267 RepID=Q01WV6_SOLUE